MSELYRVKAGKAAAAADIVVVVVPRVVDAKAEAGEMYAARVDVAAIATAMVVGRDMAAEECAS